MKAKATLTGVFSQGRLFGAPSYAPSIHMALIKDLNLTQRIELGLIKYI